jgi:hypothetical protein
MRFGVHFPSHMEIYICDKRGVDTQIFDVILALPQIHDHFKFSELKNLIRNLITDPSYLPFITKSSSHV